MFLLIQMTFCKIRRFFFLNVIEYPFSNQNFFFTFFWFFYCFFRRIQLYMQAQHVQAYICRESKGNSHIYFESSARCTVKIEIDNSTRSRIINKKNLLGLSYRIKCGLVDIIKRCELIKMIAFNIRVHFSCCLLLSAVHLIRARR